VDNQLARALELLKQGRTQADLLALADKPTAPRGN